MWTSISPKPHMESDLLPITAQENDRSFAWIEKVFVVLFAGSWNPCCLRKSYLVPWFFCQIPPWQPFEAWDSRAYQVPAHLRPILTHFSNLISSTHAILKQGHTCFLEHTIIFLVEPVPFNWSVLYIERKPGSPYQCHKVIDSWDLIVILLLTSVVTFGYINFRRPPFSCIKTGIITVHIAEGCLQN